MSKFDFIKVIVFSLVLATLLYPGFEKIYLYRQTNILEDLVMGPLAFLGENQTILSNDDKFTRYGTKYDELDFVRGQDIAINIKNEFKFHERWVNLSAERVRVFKERFANLQDEYEKIRSNKYSMIVYGPYTDQLDLTYLLFHLKVIARDPFGTKLDNSCLIFLPTTEHKCSLCKNVLRVFFADNNSCKRFMPEISQYYRDNFYSICRLDEIAANTLVKLTLGADSLFVEDRCKGGGKVLAEYEDNNLRINDILNILYLSFIVLMFVSLKTKKRNLIISLAICAFLLALPLIIFNGDYHSGYYNNLTSYAYSNYGLGKEFTALEKTNHVASKTKAIITTSDSPFVKPLGRYGEQMAVRKGFYENISAISLQQLS